MALNRKFLLITKYYKPCLGIEFSEAIKMASSTFGLQNLSRKITFGILNRRVSSSAKLINLTNSIKIETSKIQQYTIVQSQKQEKKKKCIFSNFVPYMKI